jgi:trigger factor
MARSTLAIHLLNIHYNKGYPMQVTALDSKGLKKNFKVVVDADIIQTQTEAELKEAGKNLKISGFRQGHVPMKVLQQRYGKSVQADVIKKVINNSVSDVMKNNNLRPALQPQINIEAFEDGGALEFSMAVEVFPELPEFKFDDISLDRNVFEVSESDIADAAKRIAERSPAFAELPAATKAKAGNIVRIDFKGSIDGEFFAGGTAEGFELELGSKQFIDGFEDQLIGAKAGDDVVVNVSFPEAYPSANLAGKPARFDVKVHAVLESKTPEVDEAFATARGFANLGAFTDAVKAQLTKEYEQLVRTQLKKSLFDILETKYTFDLPQGMVELEFGNIWERVQQSKAEGDPSLADKSEEELKEEYQQVAERRVRLGIMLAEVGARSKVQISREELSRAVMQQASQFPGQERQVFEFYQKNPDRMNDLRGPILEEKAVDLILSQVKFNDTKVTLDELTAMDSEEGENAPKKKPAAKTKAKKKVAE